MLKILCTSNAGGPGSIPGQGTRPHIPQLRLAQPINKINFKINFLKKFVSPPQKLRTIFLQQMFLECLLNTRYYYQASEIQSK